MFDGCGIKSTQSTFKAKMLINHLKANFDVKNLLGKSTHLLGEPEKSSHF